MTAITIAKLYRIFVLTVLTLALLSGMAGAEEASVEAVTVAIQSSDAPPPPRVLRRMESSVATVGDQVLVGRRVAEVADNKESYEKLIREVLTGSWSAIRFSRWSSPPERNTHIAVLLSPWGDVVRNVRLETDFGNISPAAAALIQQDMGNIADKINNVLLGMPVDAVDWAGGVSKSVIREILAAQLPEFRANLDIVGGQTTVVKLSLLPAGQVIRDVKVSLRSHSIPNVLLLEAQAPLGDAAEVLRGLPVAFVERHSDYFNSILTAPVANRPIVKRYGLKLSSQLNTGPETEVVVNVETTKYNVTLEGYLDVGKTTDNTWARLHIGEYVGKRDELFLETTFIPGSVSWIFAPGWGHRLSDDTTAGIKYQTRR